MLTKQIINSFEILPDAERGQAYSAIFAYIETGKEISDTAPYPVRLAFSFAKDIIDKKIARRDKDRERRERRKAMKQLSAQGVSENDSAAQATDPVVASKKEPARKPDSDNKLFSLYVRNAYQEMTNEGYRDEAINRELRRKHPGHSCFRHDPSGYYSIMA